MTTTTTTTTRETIVSGDWMSDGARYTYGYRALVPVCDIHGAVRCSHTTWNGWALPSVSAGVAEHLVRAQVAMNALYPQDDDVRIDLSFEDGVLVMRNGGDGPYAYTDRIERNDAGLFEIGLGFCWDEVAESDCDEIIG